MAASVDVDIQVNFSVSAVLPAAGSGTRMGLNTPKQFCRVLGKPLISYTIEAFERVSWIKEVIVVISKDKLVYMEDIIEEFKHNKVRIVEGGTTRHRSICNGIKGLVCDGRNPPEVVIIHDGARPLVQETLLRDVAMAAKHHGVIVILMLNLILLFVPADFHEILDNLVCMGKIGVNWCGRDKSKYRASEMPQAFLFTVIDNAYNKCTDYDFEHGTECLHLALTYSQTRAKLINGPSSLWKIIYVDSQCSPWQRETVSFISSTVCNIINHDIHDADRYNLSCEAFREMSKSNPTCQQVLLTVSLAKDPEKVTRLKKLTQDLHCRVSRTCIICIGIFVLLPGLGQLEPSQCDELAELVLDTCLNAKLIYSGQIQCSLRAWRSSVLCVLGDPVFFACSEIQCSLRARRSRVLCVLGDPVVFPCSEIQCSLRARRYSVLCVLGDLVFFACLEIKWSFRARRSSGLCVLGDPVFFACSEIQCSLRARRSVFFACSEIQWSLRAR
ncbi:predicted protein [Nematostella vectensis]|uniref:2-C-methyl-D-erythritol 4-phosphate cytidylyltransferase-like protein n=1 Tax=Nematostella vectensis TaxID=45351 RepID=A7S1B2_NEMVE|nr:predicted protein [Nematostella vectensis]|eukprot:XP_001634540.1 predicted protein [Nematostella vectensis]